MYDPIAVAEHVAAWTRTPDADAIRHVTRDWDADAWAQARLATEIHGCGPWLHRRLPDEAHDTTTAWGRFRAFLRETYALNLRRSEHWLVELRTLSALAHDRSVPAIALKGAAIVPFLLDDPAERPTADIDLLIPPGARSELDAGLRDAGYAYERSTSRHHAYFLVRNGTAAVSPLGEHPDNPLRVELHEHAVQRVLGLAFDATALVRESAGRSSIPGLACPAPGALLQHLLFHAAQDMVLGSCRLVRLHDVVAVAARVDAAGWQALQDEAVRQRVEHCILAPLVLAGRYVRPAAPVSVMEALAAATPRRLREFLERVRFSALTRCAPRSGAVGVRDILRWGRSRRQQLDMLRRLVVPTLSELQDLFGADQAQSRWWYYRTRATRAWSAARATRAPLVP